MHQNTHSTLITNSSVPIALSGWISYECSLTDKLKTITGNTQLELLYQGWINSGWWDSWLLNMNNTRIFQREIIMRSNDIEYWYAKTIIPQKCYELDPVFFKRLEQESIRNLIFGNDDVHRVKLHSYPVNQQCLEFYWVKKHINTIHGTLWVRFAEFSLRQQQSFYLIEILLPELESLS